MRILIDTHVFLWIALEPEKLSSGMLSDLTNVDNGICVSAATFWEIGIKNSIGKLPLPLPAGAFFEKEVGDRGYRVLDVGVGAGAQVAILPYPSNGHKDPFDRLLVAEAMARCMPLLSADPELGAYVQFGLELRR